MHDRDETDVMPEQNPSPSAAAVSQASGLKHRKDETECAIPPSTEPLESVRSEEEPIHVELSTTKKCSLF